MLAEAEEKLRKEGIMLWLAALNPRVFTAVSRSRIGQTLGRERMFLNLQVALERYKQMKTAEEPEQQGAVVTMNDKLRRAI